MRLRKVRDNEKGHADHLLRMGSRDLRAGLVLKKNEIDGALPHQVPFYLVVARVSGK